MGEEQPAHITLVDLNLRKSSRIQELKAWLARKPPHGKVIFVTDRNARVDSIQAFALGATDVLHRPLSKGALLRALWGDFTEQKLDPASVPAAEHPGLVEGVNALQNVFFAACMEGRIDQESIDQAASAIAGRIEGEGLGSWIDTGRKYHSQTYQHCLLVTGAAVAFGQHLGFSAADRRRLFFGAIMHDIGKVRVPIAILEKPAPLDNDEWAVMRQHPQFGVDVLRNMPGVPAEVFEIVLHHHEYLDGSGYPHGLRAQDIPDPVRLLTIADVFGALIERRAYKAPMSSAAAYETLVKMGPKLD
jgi:putative nucleotidyltransferase with HDIG domain